MALLLWSGGCDSTLLLHDMLTATHGDDGNRRGRFVTLTPSERIRVLSIYHFQVGGRDACRKARRALLPKMRKFGDFKHEEIVITSKGAGAFQNGGLIQPVVWLPNAAMHLMDNEDLYTGWIRGDDVWHYKSQVDAAFNALQVLMAKAGKLVCPMEWVSKGEVISGLQMAGLLKYTWHCENPNRDGTACGYCQPCENHALGLHYLERREVRKSTVDGVEVKLSTKQLKGRLHSPKKRVKHDIRDRRG